MQALSLNPATAVNAGAGIQEGDFRVVSAVFVAAQNPPAKDGNQEKPALKLNVGMQRLLGGKPNGEIDFEAYKVGELTDFLPSQDGDTPSSVDENGVSLGVGNIGTVGKYIVKADGGTKAGVSDKSKMMLFLSHLLGVGFDQAKMTSDPGFLVGLEGHFTRKSVAGAGTAFESKVLVLEKVVKFPYDAGAVTTPVKATTGAATPTVAAAVSTSAPAASTTASTASPALAVELATEMVNGYKAKGLTEVTLEKLAKDAIIASVKAPGKKYGDSKAAKPMMENPATWDAMLEAGIAHLDTDNPGLVKFLDTSISVQASSS